jgi:acyl-coenzyme A thioesterase 9
VNQLTPQNEEEKALFAEEQQYDERQKKRRMQDHATSMGSKSPEDAARLQALLAAGRVLTDMPALADRNHILIRDTILENVYICQPQQRNIHGRIFGGFLMRMAYQLAFSTCYLFVGHRPLFVEVDRIDFLKPVSGNCFRLVCPIISVKRK